MGLSEQGVVSPRRVRRLIENSIERFSLDLEGLVVFTEAASGGYLVTPVIAAMAKAKKVYALTKDSPYGKASHIQQLTHSFAELCGVGKRIEIVFQKQPRLIEEADIVTNLGFVRPIDARLVSKMKETAVVPLMYESWEVRQEDIDIAACHERGIPVLGTDEGHPDVRAFDFCGLLCMKMLLSLDVEVKGNKIVVVSGDKFGQAIQRTLLACGARVYVVDELRSEDTRAHLVDSDALVIASYLSADTFVGRRAHITAGELVRLSPGISVIQFAGKVELEELRKERIPFFPRREVGPFRMGKSLSYLGPKPVIDLHTAGLKVGEALARARLAGLDRRQAEEIAIRNAPAQKLSGHLEGYYP